MSHNHADSYLFEDNVDVAGNKLSYLFSLSGLHRVVPILVVSKVLRAEKEQPRIFDIIMVFLKVCSICSESADRPTQAELVSKRVTVFIIYSPVIVIVNILIVVYRYTGNCYIPTGGFSLFH